MNQRTPLLIAAALTAFMLVMVAGLATRLTQPTALAPTSTTATLDVAPALDPSVEALVREREAAYQQALAEANTRLEAANAQIAIANGQVYNNAVPAAAQSGAVSQEQAIQAAIAYHNGGEVVAVHLDDEDSAQVYEVKFSDGSTIYIDAGNGQVVYAQIEDGGERDDD